MTEKPKWMNDPLVQSIDEKKLELLNELFEKSQGKSKKDLLPSILPVLQKAKQNRLMLTGEELNSAILAIKNNSNPDEKENIDKILSKAKQKGVKI